MAAPIVVAPVADQKRFHPDGEAATRRVVFLTPGDHEIRASWSDDRVVSQQMTAKAGETTNLEFKAPPIPKKVTPAVSTLVPCKTAALRQFAHASTSSS